MNTPRTPPYKAAGAVLMVVLAAVLVVIYYQFRGDFTPKAQLSVIAGRGGLLMDPGSKVIYNGVPVGRVSRVQQILQDGVSKANLTLDVEPRYIKLIPANVEVNIQASTVFGNKYVSFVSPKHPASQLISSHDVIDVSSVTTEFNTLFETVESIAEKIDPVKVNATLSAAAQALDGLGAKFGESIVNGNDILADLNSRQSEFRYDAQRTADLADVYTAASPDLWDGLQNALIAAHTLNDQRADLDEALLASLGTANSGTAIFERGGPYLVRGATDLVPTSQLLDEYSPELFCTIHHYYLVAPKVAATLGGDNGFALRSAGTVMGAGNPWVYPDNLPRINAHGGPEGRPGCWQTITHDLWPAPYLVMDTGTSMAPYNHFGLGRPLASDYIWGRQFGENTINP